MRNLILSVVTVFSLVACGQTAEKSSASQEATEVVKATVSINDAEAKMKEANVLIIDVRTPDEFKQGHIEGAQNINVLDATFKEKVAQLNKDQAVVVYCRSGSRSAKAQGIMANMGFIETYNMQGGIMAWLAKNNKVVQ